MQYARLEINGQSGLYGFDNGSYYAIKTDNGKPVDLLEAMVAGDQLELWAKAALNEPAMKDYRYLPAVPRGSKIICIGTNYKKHLLEVGQPFPQYPVIFSKLDNALAAHEETIELPLNANKFDYEAELVLVIGRQGKQIPLEKALSHVFGVTCGNDLSARDLQFQTSQWLFGKTPDAFGPLGPHILVLKGIDPDNLEISLRLNDEVRQHGNTADMIFNCAELISFISQAITLMPGDVIFTGTPEGVIQGYPENKRVWLKAGDIVEVMLEGLPPLRNTLS